MATDLYLVLGVDADASPEQIQAAYGHWTKQLQPDADVCTTNPVRDLQQAYSVLGHPQRRSRYDERRAAEKLRIQATPARGEPLRAPEPEPGPIEVSPLTESEGSPHPSFEELFERFWSNFESLTRPKAERLESLTVEIPLTTDEARAGGNARILIPARAQCPVCGGHGAVGLYQCWRCEGHGAITADYPLELAYPAGVQDQHVVQVPLDRFGIQNFYLTVRFRVSEQLEG